MDLNPHISPSQTAEKPAPLFISTTSLFHKQKMLNALDFIWADASLGTNISSLRGNTLVPYSQNYTGYLDASQSLT
jgi:hypothetical protein